MALTNAEKQKRHRERVKQRLAAVPALDVRALAQKRLSEWEAEWKAEPNEIDKPPTVEDVALQMAKPEHMRLGGADLIVAELEAAIYDQALRALHPTDPWPELATHGQLANLINMSDAKRLKEAHKRGMEIYHGVDPTIPLTYKDKLVAHANRQWLEESQPKATKAKAQKEATVRNNDLNDLMKQTVEHVKQAAKEDEAKRAAAEAAKPKVATGRMSDLPIAEMLKAFSTVATAPSAPPAPAPTKRKSKPVHAAKPAKAIEPEPAKPVRQSKPKQPKPIVSTEAITEKRKANPNFGKF